MKELLTKTRRDLIAEVRITKRNKGYYDYSQHEDKAKEQTFIQILLFRKDGTIEDSNGRVGTWEHLVIELNLDERGDTLSRWMAHHVAELINQAQTLTQSRGRNKAQKQAIETILKIWERRENLPHRAYPLAPFKDLLKILTLLQPNNNPYRFSHLSRIDQLAAVLFD